MWTANIAKIEQSQTQCTKYNWQITSEFCNGKYISIIENVEMVPTTIHFHITEIIH